MDALGLMFLTAFSGACWVYGAFRKRGKLWVRLSAVPGVPILARYFVVVLFQAEPAMISAHVETGWPTAALMAVGVCGGLSKPHPPKPPKVKATGGSV